MTTPPKGVVWTVPGAAADPLGSAEFPYSGYSFCLSGFCSSSM
jgi:hypothetical protein